MLTSPVYLFCTVAMLVKLTHTVAVSVLSVLMRCCHCLLTPLMSLANAIVAQPAPTIFLHHNIRDSKSKLTDDKLTDDELTDDKLTDDKWTDDK